MKIYIVYDCCSSENLAYFTTREKAEKYMEDEIKGEKEFNSQYACSFDEEFYRQNTIIIEEPLDKEYTWGE